MGRSNGKKRKTIYKAKRTGEEKYIIQVVLSADAFRKLDEIASRLYPNLVRGRYSYTLQEIIDFFYAWHTHKHTRKVNPRANTLAAFRAVLKEIEKDNGVIPRIIPNPILWQYIMRALDVSDDRTIRKYLRKFAVEGLIKPLSLSEPIEKIKRYYKFAWEIVAVSI